MNIESLFSNAMFGNEVPTMITTLPEVLFEECKIMKQACDELRSHPYSFLKEHHNAGKNSYQVSVPQNIIENSFLYPYILYAGQYYLQHFKNIPMKTDQRNVRLRNNINHFDAYDFWINYSNQGNYNPPHTHRDGLGLSGVILHQTQNLLCLKIDYSFKVHLVKSFCFLVHLNILYQNNKAKKKELLLLLT